ncbi:MAG: glycosyltransferase [Bacteroidia bacterium]
MKNRAIITVTNDLVTDQRAHKIALTLVEMGYDITLVGRQFNHSKELQRTYNTKRFKLLFNKGFLFYACYNIRLFFYLIVNPADLIWSCDLDTLSACYLSSKIKKSKLVYDSHELFTEVPELNNRPTIKKIWLIIEQWIFPKLKIIFTVSHSIAKIYSEKYKVDVRVVRNLPFKKDFLGSFSDRENIILYQGAINLNRGVEELVLAMNMVSNASLLIVGDGDVINSVKELVRLNNLENKVKFFGKVPFEDLDEISNQAILGVSLEKSSSKSYAYSLPNKVFDYIKNGVPVLVSNLPEVKKIVEQYNVGQVLNEISPKEIADKINVLLSSKEMLQHYSKNCVEAHQELNWEHEKQIIISALNE